jgi:hypothetical protein
MISMISMMFELSRKSPFFLMGRNIMSIMSIMSPASRWGEMDRGGGVGILYPDPSLAVGQPLGLFV